MASQLWTKKNGLKEKLKIYIVKYIPAINLILGKYIL